MDKALGKLGIYDIIGVWLTGVIIFFLTAIITNEVYHYHILQYSHLANPIVIVAGGYFVGMFFQEIGNFLQRTIINKNEKMIHAILNETRTSFINRNTGLTDVEKEYFHNSLEFKDKKSDPEYIYNHCKYQVVSKTDVNGMDRNQVTAAISRSLGVYFVLVFFMVTSTMLCITDKIVAKCIVAAVSVFLSILFFYRSYRFVRIRYVQYFRAFYFDQNL